MNVYNLPFNTWINDNPMPYPITADLTSLLQKIIDLEAENHTLRNQLQAISSHDAQHIADYTADLRAQNEELDAYAQTVAHDLKSPISHLLGFASHLSAEFDNLSPDEIKTLLQYIVRGAEKATTIVDELLLLAQIRKVEVTFAPIDMNLIVSEAIARLSGMIDETGARIMLPAEWPTSIGYQPWIEEIWVNYLSNALKYGGHPPLVELGSSDVGNGRIRFWVRDNGKGLSAEQQAKLFIPFTRLEKNHADGTGLGLSIVQRISERLGGQVGVDSTINQGSTFWFELPAA